MQPVVRNLKILAPSMLGAKMEGSLSFLTSLVRNKLYTFCQRNLVQARCVYKYLLANSQLKSKLANKNYEI